MTQIYKYTNRLALSSSPYLLQHAHNPVNWYPWGSEAFDLARHENKPIFLSIGYSTCHWCHVMAHESFEDESVANLLNEHFISIKVDREERPDIDQLYMTVATSLIGRGGWPLTIVMDHNKHPFFAGTYFPKVSSSGRMGMLDLLPRISDAWKNQREEISNDMDQILASIQQQNETIKGDYLGEEILEKAAGAFRQAYDPEAGGFGSAPKFPSPHNLVFLLREGYRTGNSSYTDMAVNTLKKMRLGGLFDHIGYGFHRYSTDASWHVPHFEKMLYDQATLLTAYTEAWEATGDPLFRRTMDEIFSYLTDNLKSPSGAYYSAEDADSDGGEGLFYIWSWKELEDVVGTDQLDLLSIAFGLNSKGNFKDEASGQPSGKNIFHLSSEESFQVLYRTGDWEKLRQKLYTIRELRAHPGLDDKILCDWNGLLLASLSQAARVTGDERFELAAKDLAEYIKTSLIGQDGRLLHMPKRDSVSIYGFLDDYSFVIQGFRQYYELSYDTKFLEEAIRLQNIQLENFWDQEAGAMFFTDGRNKDLLIRQKEIYDGAIPSGNSVTAANLHFLGRITENPAWESLSREIGAVFSEQINRSPRGFAALLQSTQIQVSGSEEWVIAGERSDLEAVTDMLKNYYNPFALTLYRPNKDFDTIEKIAGFLSYQKSIDGGLTVYICQDYVCQKPITDIENLRFTLEGR
ncbi:MAG: thioredoxin domain-containing protein [Candidatus Marinimicrobia bacterium]|nr:thioredoxin domain-containing protein [Candidatus Neomarinimicrobiota bacterium]